MSAGLGCAYFAKTPKISTRCYGLYAALYINNNKEILLNIIL